MSKKNKNGKLWHVRQGDVLIIKTNGIKEGAPKPVESITCALGEKTGHHHTLMGGGLAVLEDDGKIASEFSIEQDQEITHQEHGAIPIPAGSFRSVIQTEFSGNELKRVAD